MEEQLQTIGMLIIKGVLAPIIVAFLAWASAHLPAFLKSKVKNVQIGGILERLSQLAFAVVQEMQQTIVSSLGAEANEAQLLAVRDQAVATLKSHLGDKGMKEIETVLGLENQDAVIKMLITFIEQAVNTLKKSEPIPPSPPSASGSSKNTVVTIPPPFSQAPAVLPSVIVAPTDLHPAVAGSVSPTVPVAPKSPT